MIILTQTTDKVQVVLSGAITTNQLQCFASFRDRTSTTFTPNRTAINTNNTTAIDLVDSPAASTQRIVDLINVYNADTASAVVTVRINDNGTIYIIWKGTLLSGETLSFIEGMGWVVSTISRYREEMNIPLHADATNNLTFTNATDAERLAATRSIVVVNLEGYTQVRLKSFIVIGSASANTPLLRLKYAVSFTSVIGSYIQMGLSANVDVPTVTTSTYSDSGWLDLAVGARIANCYLGLVTLGGDGVADPAIANTFACFR